MSRPPVIVSDLFSRDSSATDHRRGRDEFLNARVVDRRGTGSWPATWTRRLRPGIYPMATKKGRNRGKKSGRSCVAVGICSWRRPVYPLALLRLVIEGVRAQGAEGKEGGAESRQGGLRLSKRKVPQKGGGRRRWMREGDEVNMRQVSIRV